MHPMRPFTRSSSRTTRARVSDSGEQSRSTARLAALCGWLTLVGCQGDGATSTDDGTTQATGADASSGSDDGTTAAPDQTGTAGPDLPGTSGDPTAPDPSAGTDSTGSTGGGESTTGGLTVDPSAGDETTSSTTGDDSASTTGDVVGSTGDDDTGSTGDESTGSTGDDGTTGSCESADRAVKLKRLIDPLDGSVIAPAIVIVHEDRVIAVETDEAKIPCGAEVIDWSAYTGVPGLVDVHTHFVYQTDDEPGTFPWTRSWWIFKNKPALLEVLAREAAEKVVKLGVTTAIDKGAGPGDKIVAKLRDQIASGELVGPRIYTAGYGISGPVPSTETMKGWIKQNVADGADLIKVWADSCSDDTLECKPNFTFEQLKAAVDQAHELGRPIAIHAYHADTAKLAIMAGPDSMEHPEGLDAVDFMDMIAMGITYVPTIDHNRYYKENLAYFGYDPAMGPKFAAYIAENLETANQAHLAGVQIAMGSDAVFSGFGENKRELEWFIEAGMTPLEALRAATVKGAASIGVEDEVGRVAVGYFADIVAVDGDPLSDITVLLDEVHGVMKSGEPILP